MVVCTSETKEHQACRDGWVAIEGPTVRRTRAHRWRGSFSQGFGIGVWRRGSGCILRAGRPTLAIRTGRMKRTLQVVIAVTVRAANTRRAIAAILPITPWARVQRYCTVPGRIDCLDITGHLFVAHMIHVRALRVGVLQALAWYQTAHSQRRGCTASASNAVRRCVRKKGWACLAGGHCWTVGRREGRRVPFECSALRHGK